MRDVWLDSLSVVHDWNHCKPMKKNPPAFTDKKTDLVEKEIAKTPARFLQRCEETKTLRKQHLKIKISIFLPFFLFSFHPCRVLHEQPPFRQEFLVAKTARAQTVLKDVCTASLQAARFPAFLLSQPNSHIVEDSNLTFGILRLSSGLSRVDMDRTGFKYK